MLLLSQTELPATQSGIRSASPRPPAHSQVRGTRAPAAPPRSPTCTPHRSIPRANLTCNCIASFQRQVILATCLWTHSAFPPAIQNKSKNTGHSRNGDDMFILADACLLHVVVKMQTCNTGLAHRRFTIKFVQMKYLQNAIKPQLTLQLLADESS